MASVNIVADLPFPLRVGSTPYRVKLDSAVWTLEFELIRQQSVDPRLGWGTGVELEIDRAGLASYSKVTATAEVQGTASHDAALHSFLTALNTFISHARDILSIYWIRTLEAGDLGRRTVVVDGVVTTSFVAERFGGLTLPVNGMSEEADSRILSALGGSRKPPVWRQMQLDARDALEMGRYEDAVVLGWSALETACRQSLPGLAHERGVSVDDFAKKLGEKLAAKGGLKHAKNNPPLSFEAVLARVNDGLVLVNQAAELAEPLSHAPRSIGESVRRAHFLRNKVVHQGARISPSDAVDAQESTAYVLTALRFRDVAPPPATLSWRQVFGQAGEEVTRFAEANELRLVVSPERGALFEMEWLAPELWVRIAPEIDERLARTFLFVEWDTMQRCLSPGRPCLRIQGNPFWLPGLTHRIARGIERGVCRAEALIAAARTDKNVSEAAALMIERIIGDLRSRPKLKDMTLDGMVLPARVAACAAVVPEAAKHVLEELSQCQPVIARRSQSWTRTMVGMNPDDPHARCAVYRTIHADCSWADSILVECPVERATFGTGRKRWPEGAIGPGQ